MLVALGVIVRNEKDALILRDYPSGRTQQRSRNPCLGVQPDLISQSHRLRHSTNRGWRPGLRDQPVAG